MLQCLRKRGGEDPILKNPISPKIRYSYTKTNVILRWNKLLKDNRRKKNPNSKSEDKFVIKKTSSSLFLRQKLTFPITPLKRFVREYLL
jgi:hypothetical protein